MPLFLSLRLRLRLLIFYFNNISDFRGTRADCATVSILWCPERTQSSVGLPPCDSTVLSNRGNTPCQALKQEQQEFETTPATVPVDGRCRGRATSRIARHRAPQHARKSSAEHFQIPARH